MTCFVMEGDFLLLYTESLSRIVIIPSPMKYYSNTGKPCITDTKGREPGVCIMEMSILLTEEELVWNLVSWFKWFVFK